MTRLLKATQLPPGSRMLSRSGAALTGAEIAEATLRVIERIGELEDVPEELVQEVVERVGDDLRRGAWCSDHLTYPQARIEIAATGTSTTFRADARIQLTQRLTVNASAGKMAGVMWEAYKKVESFGPSNIPDDLREKMGLPLTGQFRLPNGDIVTAELPTEAQTKRQAEGPQWGTVQGRARDAVQESPDERRRQVAAALGVPLTGAELVGSETAVVPEVQAAKVETVKTPAKKVGKTKGGK